jgi:LemA protein
MGSFVSVITGIILTLIILGLSIVIIKEYLRNSLVAKKNQIDNAFASIDVMLTKRAELLPKLVAATKEYMKFEQQTLTDIARYRARAGQTTGDERVDVENQISRAIGNIMIAVESYPELKASQQFQDLQRSFNEIEEQLSAARRFFNSAITDYNNAIDMFPTNLLAPSMGYQSRQVFEATERQRADVDVASLFSA